MPRLLQLAVCSRTFPTLGSLELPIRALVVTLVDIAGPATLVPKAASRSLSSVSEKGVTQSHEGSRRSYAFPLLPASSGPCPKWRLVGEAGLPLSHCPWSSELPLPPIGLVLRGQATSFLDAISSSAVPASLVGSHLLLR